MSMEPKILVKQSVIKLSITLVSIVSFFSLFTLLGYALNAEYIYRPIENGAATNPVTAILFLLLSLDILFVTPRKKVRHALGVLALLIAGVYLFAEWVEWLLPLEITKDISPFSEVVKSEQLAGLNNEMGINTLLMFSFLLLSCYFRKCHQVSLSQIFGFLTLFFPLLSITGYAYQIENFHGQMSLITTILGMLLTGANLLVRSKKGILGYFWRQGEDVREARMKVLLSYFVPFVLGYTVLQTTIASSVMSLFSLMVMMACWLGIAFVIYDMVLRAKHEKSIAVLTRRLTKVERHDVLTDMLNRHVFMTELQQSMVEEHALDNSLWVMNVDIDNMRKINQDCGFSFGDQVIAEMGKLMQDSLPAKLNLVRFDGDSYLVVVKQAHLDLIWSLAEKLRHHLTEQLYRKYRQTITVSIGVAYQESGSEINFAISKAEMATLQAKKKGKNQVFFSSDKVYQFS
ncbi:MULTISPECIES: GGDEF domain-containing protein [unclassified Vibrio]|uniref:diguanylate cyclase n=1 Tax=Vibrio sp. HB236076 TaxID=3232307 RepID=A0AB39HKD7_9VIBR|nr:GGDEF domain-containing protein [Vibrio sp. HB161653]MDP5252585.1 GGDEF domain-containing protein [Vibrio sp. HB161653]